MKLIDNWRSAWKLFSVQALAVIAFAQTVLAVVPPEYLNVKIAFTDTTYGGVLVALTIAAAVIGGLGRLIDQGSSEPK